MDHSVLRADPSLLWASHFHSTEESVSPDFHPWGGRDVWRVSRDGDSWGGKCRFLKLIYFFPFTACSRCHK